MTHGMMCHCHVTSTSLRRMFCWSQKMSQEENAGPADNAADHVQDFKVFMTKVKAGTFSALHVSFENSKQILELSTPSCSMTPLLIDYGLE